MISIGEEAFGYCSGLTSVTISNGVTTIGWRAFRGCENLKSVTIPSSVTSIGEGAFDGTPWLKSLGDFAVINGILLCYQGNDVEVTIPSSVTSIGEGAFEGCENLKSVTFPASLTSIGENAFNGCESLLGITIPDGVASIGNWTFSNCSSVPSFTIPSSVTSIGEGAFYNCTSLTNVTIPASVIVIGELAFDACEGLADVYYDGSESDWNKIQIQTNNECLTSATIHFNSSSQDDYQDAGTFSSDNLPQYPSDGKDEWIIFKEGSRNNRVEMSTFTLTSNSSNTRIVWNNGLSVTGSSTVDSCNQYYLNSEGNWAYLGEYDVLTDWATEVIASSLDVYDSNGNLIIEESDLYRKNSSYIDLSKIWSFANSRTEFPMASNGYYMSDKDFKKLMGGLNNIDRKLVAGDLMYYGEKKQLVGYTTEGVWTEKNQRWFTRKTSY